MGKREDDTDREQRARRISVAISFGDREELARLGSGVVDVVCPACGHKGARFGNPGDDFRFEGFVPRTRGGLAFIDCDCDACHETVTLPHRPARAS